MDNTADSLSEYKFCFNEKDIKRQWVARIGLRGLSRNRGQVLETEAVGCEDCRELGVGTGDKYVFSDISGDG